MSKHSSISTPKVSVIIPCYNSEKYLSKCLSSLAQQTISDIEYIFINDGSNDSTLTILKDYQRNYPNTLVVNKSNSGYGDSLNLGLKLAHGNYIGIIEPDDFIEPNMFEVLFEMAIKHNLDIARCSYYYSSQVGESIQDWPLVPKNQLITPLNHISVFKQGPSVWANLYKRSWLDEHGISFLTTPGASFQDTSFCFKAYFLAERFMMTDQPLLHYRIDNENSSVHDRKKIFCVMDEWKEIFRFVSTMPSHCIDTEKLIELKNRTYLWNLGRLDKKGKRLFIDKWHNETKCFYERNPVKLHKLPLLHFILEIAVLYCPYILSTYNKNSSCIKFIKKFVH